MTSGFLLDTNVVSEFRRPKPHGGVFAWLSSMESEKVFISAATIGELQAGIEITRDQSREKAAAIEAWLEQLITSYSVLPMDHRAFRAWARIMHRKSDQLLGDALIGATAIAHGLIVASRNVKDFNALGVPVYNPFTFRE
jgi:toxin FitB